MESSKGTILDSLAVFDEGAWSDRIAVEGSRATIFDWVVVFVS